MTAHPRSGDFKRSLRVSDPETIAFAEALARAHVARDIAAAKERARANTDLRPLL